MITVDRLYERLQQCYELDVYGKRGITLVRGAGARVWDDKNREYIDCIGGHGAANLGHGHPRILEAIHTQSQKLISCPGSFYNDAKALFLDRLMSLTPEGLNRAFLCNSGAEAVEAALKFARITTGRNKIVAVKGGFHGRTFGAMSATFNPKYAAGSGALVPHFSHVGLNDSEALTNEVGEETAAIILEPIQGENGVRFASESFLQTGRDLCNRHGALLIFDEVQTGFCRTGKMFACEHFQIIPDLLCLAKSIAAGLPMGAVVASDRVQVPVGRHGSTFGGNPLVCAVAKAALQVMVEDRLAEQASAKGKYLYDRLMRANLPMIREIRQQGLMIGIELKVKAKPLAARLGGLGVLVLTSGQTVIRLLPPLVIAYQDLDRLVGVFCELLENQKIAV